MKSLQILIVELKKSIKLEIKRLLIKKIFFSFSLSFDFITHSFYIDGKYLVLPSGELHIREVGPEDGYKSYQCRTKHRLTGETRLSATKGRLVITGMFR